MKEKRIPNPDGRPKTMIDGKRRNIYIDESSWQKAKKIGNGKPSEGIRRALATVKDCLKVAPAPAILPPTPDTRPA